jgi:hypothetical protein
VVGFNRSIGLTGRALGKGEESKNGHQENDFSWADLPRHWPPRFRCARCPGIALFKHSGFRQVFVVCFAKIFQSGVVISGVLELLFEELESTAGAFDYLPPRPNPNRNSVFFILEQDTLWTILLPRLPPNRICHFVRDDPKNPFRLRIIESLVLCNSEGVTFNLRRNIRIDLLSGTF